MTPAVTHITPDTTLAQAAALMRDLDVGALPVCEDGRPVGIVTDRDLIVRCVAEGRAPTATVAHGMTRALHTVKAGDDVAAAIARMEQAQVRRLLVLDDAGALAGIVSLGDLAVRQARSLDETLEKISEPAGG